MPRESSFVRERLVLPVNECDSRHNRSRIATYLCCFKLKVGVRIYSTLDTILGLVYLLCTIHLFLSHKDYKFIDFHEALTISGSDDSHKKETTTQPNSEQIKRREHVHTVLQECGGQHYIREHSPDEKKFQFTVACILAMVAAIGFCLAGFGLLLSTILSMWRSMVMRNLRKHRKKIPWIYLWVQIPWMFIAFISAVLMHGDNLCEIDVKENFRAYILWLTLLALLVYKPHELAIVIYYLGEMHDNAKLIRKLQLQQKRLQRMNDPVKYTTSATCHINQSPYISEKSSVSENSVKENSLLSKITLQYSDTTARTSVSKVTNRNQHRRAEIQKTAPQNPGPSYNRENEILRQPSMSEISLTSTNVDASTNIDASTNVNVGNDDFEFDESISGAPFDDQFL